MTTKKDFDFSEETVRHLAALTPTGVPAEAGILRFKYYAANREEGRAYVLLPQQNFIAWFSNTNFSQKFFE